MANEEGVKIIITAEDRFSETMKKIDASSKIFGETTKNTQRNLEALEKEMVRLVANGLDPADKKIKEMKANYDKLSQSLKGGDASLKKSNQQWTNLALVVQDLPYGFRGIQNNLPALMGGIAGMAGPLYLVGSAVIALFTAWDAGLFKVKNSTTALNDIQKEYNETLKSSMGSAGEEIAKINALVSIASDHEVSMEKRLSAVKKLQDEYPSYFGNLDKEKILNGDVATAVDGVKLAIIERGKATAIASKINAIAAQKFVEEEKLYQLALQKTVRMQKDIALATSHGYKGKALKGYLDFTLFDIREKEKEIGRVINSYESELNRLGDLYAESTKASIGLDDGKPKPTKNKQATKDTYLLDSLKAKQQAYKDDIYAFRAYGILIINEEEKLAVARAKADGTYEKNKKDIHARYEADRLTNNNLFEANLNKVLDDNAKIRTAQEKKELEIQAANRLNIAKGILEINKQFAEDDLRNAILFAKNQTKIIETELGVQDKLNRNNLTNRIQFTEEALAKLVALAAYTFDPKVLAVYLDAIDKINAKLKGMGETWDTTANQIKGILEGVMADSITKFAENIGTALAGGKVDLFGGIGEMIADGAIAIGKALIAYGVALKAFEMAKLDPVLAIVAGAGLVIAGTVLKAKLAPKEKGGAMPFANGGIVSGPTMGLVGEYPGAKTNPEVIAPLDKLKDMIGGGGNGEFVLRGNDLVLALQRSNSSLNLRRGGI
jgi:hypothetical protein